MAAADSITTACQNTNIIKANDLLTVTDSVSGQHILIDTVSDVSIIPCKNGQDYITDLKLFAANTSTNTYGTAMLVVFLNFRCVFKWVFIEVPVSNAIIEDDFFYYFNLLIDTRNKKLLDKMTNLSTNYIEEYSLTCL